MKLPNASNAVVERAKITDYLLDPVHPDNGGKAAFFAALGFGTANWQILAAALKELAIACPVSSSVPSPHGDKYIIVGPIETMVEKRPLVRTVWIVDKGSDRPRLVTAYPHED